MRTKHCEKKNKKTVLGELRDEETRGIEKEVKRYLNGSKAKLFTLIYLEYNNFLFLSIELKIS
jgi:hypothetical protein